MTGNDGNKKARLKPRFFVASVYPIKSVQTGVKKPGLATPASNQPNCC
jgi:hypothetical protein